MDRIISQPSAPGGTQPEGDEETLADSGFFWRESEGVKILVCAGLEKAGFSNGFSTRLGGVSPFPAGDLNLAGFDEDAAENIEENRRRFLHLFPAGMRLATVWQVHGDTVLAAGLQAESENKADALVSNEPGTLIGVKTADCVPVLIGDPRTGAFAAVHAGWRGTVAVIVRKAVTRIKDAFGADPADLVCAIGPAASVRNYEIGADVIEAFADKVPTGTKYLTPTRAGHALVDLHMANRDQLIGEGVRESNIYTAPFCTMERPDIFFSYRLEKRKYGKTGRLLSVIGRAPNERSPSD